MLAVGVHDLKCVALGHYGCGRQHDPSLSTIANIAGSAPEQERQPGAYSWMCAVTGGSTAITGGGANCWMIVTLGAGGAESL